MQCSDAICAFVIPFALLKIKILQIARIKMIYPNELDTKESGLSDTALKKQLKENIPNEVISAVKKKRRILASNTSSGHYKKNHHQYSQPRHSNPNTNHLQLPAIHVDNAFARDNSSICHRIEEGPLESLWTNFCIFCIRIDTKLAVYIAACIGIALNGIGILFYLFQNQFLYALPSLVSAIVYFCALLAQYRQKANLFLLFLIINGLILFLWTWLCVYLASLFILLPDWCVQLIMEYYEWEKLGQIIGTADSSERIRNKARLFFALSFGFTLIYLAVECWLWSIIYRGFKAVKDKKAEEWLNNLEKNIRSISIY